MIPFMYLLVSKFCFFRVLISIEVDRSLLTVPSKDIDETTPLDLCEYYPDSKK